MTFRVGLAAVIAITATFALVGPLVHVVRAQAPPSLPTIYSGTATAAGDPVPDSLVDDTGACIELCIRARIGSDFESLPLAVKNGPYAGVTVGVNTAHPIDWSEPHIRSFSRWGRCRIWLTHSAPTPAHRTWI